MTVVLLDPTRRWECPSCHRQIVSTDTSTQPRLHPCKALRGLLAPFVEIHGTELPAGQVRHVVHDRDDYVGSELVQTDNTGRPVMAISTERADGSNDLAVLAPTAQGRFDR